MEERLGEMRKGRRKRIRKGAIVSSSPQGMTSWSSIIKICYNLIVGEERGLRRGAEREYRDREKRDKRELS